MAIASLRTLGLRSAPEPEETAFTQLFGTLAASPSVEIIAVNYLGGYIDLWARMGDDDEANEMALYDALASYHGSPGVTTPVDLHLVLASEPDDAFPSSSSLLYRRRP